MIVRRGLGITHLYPDSYQGFMEQQGKLETLAPRHLQIE